MCVVAISLGDWILCMPVVIAYLLAAMIFSIHPTTRTVAVVAALFGVAGGIFSLFILSSAPLNDFYMMGAVSFQICFVVAGLPVLIVWAIGCVLSASRRKRRLRTSKTQNGEVERN